MVATDSKRLQDGLLHLSGETAAMFAQLLRLAHLSWVPLKRVIKRPSRVSIQALNEQARKHRPLSKLLFNGQRLYMHPST